MGFIFGVVIGIVLTSYFKSLGVVVGSVLDLCIKKIRRR